MRTARNSSGSALCHLRPAHATVLAFIACLLLCAAAAAALKSQAHNWPNTPVRHTLKQQVAAVTPSFSANLRGGVAVAGNTLETCPQNQPGNEVCAGNSYNNNDQNMVYVNVDPGNGRFNSSSANLTIPAGAHVVKAFLYWAGDLSRGVANGQGNRTGSAAPDGDTRPSQPPHTRGQATSDQLDVRDREAPRRHRVHVHHGQRIHAGIAPGQMGLGRELVFGGTVRIRPRGWFPRLGLPGPRRRHRPTEQRVAGSQGQAQRGQRDHARHGRQRAGRHRAQPLRRLEPDRGVGAAQRGVSQHHAVRWLCVGAGPGRSAARRRTARLQRLSDSGQWERRRARDRLGHRGRPGNHRRLHVARQPERSLRPAHQTARRRPSGRQLLQQHDLQGRCRRRRTHPGL